MKIGTDAVLLGAWANVESCQALADLGTGCGVIALMLAQRTEGIGAQIDAIDIEQNAAEQAASNANHSPWPDRVAVTHCSVAELVSRKPNHYDHCISNPPYFEGSLPSEDKRQRLARHVGQMTRLSLLESARKLLNDRGRLSLILPYDQLESIIEQSLLVGFQLHRQTLVRAMPGKPWKRVLLEFGFGSGRVVNEEMTVEVKRHQFSNEYEELTRKFHLRYAI